MTIAELIQEFEAEAKTTRRVLERVPTDKLTWTPHTKSMSLGRLAMHLASAPAAISSWPIADELRVQGRPDAAADVHRSRSSPAHDAGVEQVKANLQTIGDAGLGDSWSGIARRQDVDDDAEGRAAARAADESHLPSPRPAVGVSSTARRAGAADLRPERRRESVQVTIGRRSVLRSARVSNLMLRALVLATLLTALPAASAVQAPSVLNIKVVVKDADGRATPVPRYLLLVSENPPERAAAPRHDRARRHGHRPPAAGKLHDRIGSALRVPGQALHRGSRRWTSSPAARRCSS